MDTERLLEAARAGDRDAFVALVEPHRPRLWTIVRTVARRRADAEDLLQDVTVKAFVALRRYEGDASLLGAWLARIAINAAHDGQRSAWLRKVLRPGVDPSALPDDPDPDADTHGQVERAERRRQVRAAVLALPRRQRVPIHLVYFDGLSIAEAARLEGVAESTLRGRIDAGLRTLARRLGEPLGERPAPATERCP